MESCEWSRACGRAAGGDVPFTRRRWDLTGRAELETTVKNLSERPVTVHLAIDNPGSKRAERQNCCIESVTIPRGEEAAVRLKIRARVPAALQEKLRGLRGTPRGFASGGRGTVDPADVAGIRSTFTAVGRLRAGGVEQSSPAAVLRFRFRSGWMTCFR